MAGPGDLQAVPGVQTVSFETAYIPMSKNRQYRTFALCVMSIVITVGVVYYDGSATSSTENPSAPNRSDDIEIRGASRRAAKPITTKEASDFAVNVDLRERYHKWAEDLSVSTGRQGMGHTANVREQVRYRTAIRNDPIS